MTKREPFFMKDTPVHWGLTLHAALCGSGWLNSSHDRKQVTCPKCQEALDEIIHEAVERSQTWEGLMDVLDKHYPATIFDGSSGDEGPRIVVLTREVNRLREALSQVVDRAVLEEGTTWKDTANDMAKIAHAAWLIR